MASFARSTRSDSRSQSARISTPSILASLRVVPVPRLPRPITATPTVSSAGAAYPCILKLLRLLRITTYSSGLFHPERPAPIIARVARPLFFIKSRLSLTIYTFIHYFHLTLFYFFGLRSLIEVFTTVND